MIFKYWIEFDKDGEIKSFYKSKNECSNNCKEYIVKLIPINRTEKELSKVVDDTANMSENIVKQLCKLNTEMNKMVKDLRRFKI